MTDSTTTKTTCPYCGVGCGLVVAKDASGTVQVRGDPDHPANLGRLCSKGAALGETLGEAGRLLHPEIGGERVSWAEALDTVAGRFRQVVDEHGPDAVAFYVSGQLLTEDYYVANKLMKGFIGSGNIDTNSRLCMSSSVAGHKRAFGGDVVPCSYEDLELADLIVLVGSNAAWCHPVLYQRIRAARVERPDMKVVVVDPRRTATCDIADLHLPLKPGTDTALFGGLLDWLDRNDHIDWRYVVNHTQGFAEAVAAARLKGDPVRGAAAACGLAPEDVETFFQWFGATGETVSVYSQGVNQWSFGTDKVNAIINCHLATGRIGRPGAGPFSFTGQPNAMGGREVGGLANQLAAHMDFGPDDVARVQRFWNAPSIATHPGLKAVDLFEAVGQGKIKAVWILATNPAVSLPDADRFRSLLEACDFVVVSDCVRHTDTTACADVLLPAATWGEKDGTVTNSERRISRQRAFLPLPGEARPDWWAITEVARRLGFGTAFPYDRPAAVFREHAALSGFENHGERSFDISALSDLSDAEYEELAPVQWPVARRRRDPPDRIFAGGSFFTPDHRARFIPVGARSPAVATDEAYPLVLNTGRIRDQWHTMTRTARSPRLTAHRPEPFVEINPVDATMWQLAEGDLARVTSRQGELLARVRHDGGQRPGSVFVPMHWSDQFALSGRVDAVANPALDPWSGQPEFKHTPVRVEPAAMAWQGFILSREPLQIDGAAYRVQVPSDGVHRYELAGERISSDWGGWARGLVTGAGDWIEFRDAARGRYRAALIRDGRLLACLFVTEGHELPERDWLVRIFGETGLDAPDRASLLAGRPAAGRADAGQVVCACFNVGVKTIVEAIGERGLTTVEAIGAALKAGTNCGSCVPELRSLLADALKEVA
jgi:assimilatory nitrate reductase catalytic subunit